MTTKTRLAMYAIVEEGSQEEPVQGYFQVGDEILMGKWKNKRGKIVAFGKDKWGSPTIEVEPIPKGRKKNKVMGLFRIWRANIRTPAPAAGATSSGTASAPATLPAAR